MLRFVLVALWCCAPLAARADVFVVAPPYYEGTDGRSVSERIVRAIEMDLGKQHEVVGPLEAARLVPAEHRVSCPEGACAERYREAASAIAAIVVRVGRAAGDGAATSFQLGIQPAPGVEYSKGAVLSDGPLETLAVKALRDALRDYRQGPGPWLEIVGAPEQANVFVDDRAAGTLPWTDTVSVGSHRVRVEASGFEPMIQVVTLTSPTDRKRLAFRLEPVRVAPRVEVPQEGPSPLPESARGMRLIAGGTALAAVGAGIALWPVVAHLRSGCEHEEAGVCTSRSELPTGMFAGLLAGGGVAAAAGVVLISYGWSLRRNARSDLAIGAQGIFVRGSF